MKVPRAGHGHGLSWSRVLGEGLLIIVSVFTAIWLEGVFQDRGRHRDALIALVQVEDELRQDRADLAAIIDEQTRIDGEYTALLRWLATPASMPVDSVGAALDRLSFSNRTLYPHRAAWTALATSHATSIDDPRLLARLGRFYETLRERIVDNGNHYDFNLDEVMRGTVPAVWDGTTGRLSVRDPRAIAELRARLRYLHIGWNRYYLDLVREYGVEIDGLVADVDAYLAARGMRDRPAGAPGP